MRGHARSGVEPRQRRVFHPCGQAWGRGVDRPLEPMWTGDALLATLVLVEAIVCRDNGAEQPNGCEPVCGQQMVGAPRH